VPDSLGAGKRAFPDCSMVPVNRTVSSQSWSWWLRIEMIRVE
jgi:hypothetical protein